MSICGDCFGSGIVEVDGDPLSCMNCSGWGSVQEEDGIVTCVGCFGLGNVVIESLDGDDTQSECPFCEGKGWVEVTYYDETVFEEFSRAEANEAYWNEVEESSRGCDYCFGEGYSQGQPCPMCTHQYE